LFWNNAALSIFPSIHINFYNHSLSDHAPIVFNLFHVTECWKKIHFKFNNAWVYVTGYKGIVEKAWSDNYFGNPLIHHSLENIGTQEITQTKP
jgi:aminopeptidase C